MKFPKDSISASMINCYFDCPAGFKLTVIDEMWFPEGPALEIGSMVDEMFKSFHKGKNPELAARKKFLSGKFNKETINNFAEAKKLFEIYKRDPDVFNNPEFDIRFKVPIMNPITNKKIENIALKGFLDGFAEDRIKELKTSADDYTQERVDSALQAKIYAYGKYITDGKIYPVDYIVIGKKTKKVGRLTYQPKLEDFALLFETIKMFIELVEAEEFDPNPDHPYWCACRKD